VRGFFLGTSQIVAAGFALAAISGLVGLLVVHFAGLGGVVKGVGYGMVVGGAIVGFVTGGSGSPTENLYRGRVGAFGTYWGESNALPQSPLQVALGSLLTFAAGIALVVLTYR
jgi:hypothetical protein